MAVAAAHLRQALPLVEITAAKAAQVISQASLIPLLSGQAAAEVAAYPQQDQAEQAAEAQVESAAPQRPLAPLTQAVAAEEQQRQRQALVVRV